MLLTPTEDDNRSQSASGQFVQSLERGLAVIRCFGDDRERLTLSEVARLTGLTRAAARRFLLTLETLGYVHSTQREFSLTAKVLELGFSYLSSLPFRDVAERTLQLLSEQTGQSSSVSVLDGSDIVYIARVHTKNIMRVNINLGTRFPAFATSMGRVLLAGQSDEVVNEVLTRSQTSPLTPHTIVDRFGLEDIIRQTRVRGWALVDQELEVGLCSLAVPIVGGDQKTVAAMNISIPSQKLENRDAVDDIVRSYLPPLQHAATEIERAVRVTLIE